MSNESDSRSPKPAEQKPRRQGSQPAKRGGRAAPTDERRKRRSSPVGSARLKGFADGLDHAICINYAHRPPREFPPHDRAGLAVIPLSDVARRPGAVLHCDRQHPGPCQWPDGEISAPDEPVPAAL